MNTNPKAVMTTFGVHVWIHSDGAVDDNAVFDVMPGIKEYLKARPPTDADVVVLLATSPGDLSTPVAAMVPYTPQSMNFSEAIDAAKEQLAMLITHHPRPLPHKQLDIFE